MSVATCRGGGAGLSAHPVQNLCTLLAHPVHTGHALPAHPVHTVPAHPIFPNGGGKRPKMFLSRTKKNQASRSVRVSSPYWGKTRNL